METIKVRYLGPRDAIRAHAGAEPTPKGEVLELTPAVVSRMRGLRHKFEAVEDEPLPEPEPQPEPEGRQTEPPRPSGPTIEVVRH